MKFRNDAQRKAMFASMMNGNKFSSGVSLGSYVPMNVDQTINPVMQNLTYKTQYEYSIAPQKEYIPGGLASGCPDDEFDPKQMEKGMKVELEHVVKFTDKGNVKKPSETDLAKAKEISKDHLSEIPDYYDRLEALEEQAKSDGVFIDVEAKKKAEASMAKEFSRERSELAEKEIVKRVLENPRREADVEIARRVLENVYYAYEPTEDSDVTLALDALDDNNVPLAKVAIEMMIESSKLYPNDDKFGLYKARDALKRAMRNEK